MGTALRSAGALLAVLAVAAPAADGAIVKRSASKKLDEPLEIANVTAKCPNGANATGGGYRLSPNSVARNRTGLVFESRKDGQDAWRVRAQLSEGSSGSARLTAFVYCDRRGPSTSEAAKPGATSTSNEVKAATARCPGAKKAQAGGFATPAPFFTGGNNAALNVVSASVPAGTDGWKAQVTAGFSFSPFPSSFTAYAYCANRPAPDKRSGTKAVKPNANNPSEFGKGSARSRPCPGPVVAGGFSQRPINPSGGLESKFLTVYASLIARDRWKASAVQGGLAQSRLTAVALCR